jgi:hypothetical protein
MYIYIYIYISQNITLHNYSCEKLKHKKVSGIWRTSDTVLNVINSKIWNNRLLFSHLTPAVGDPVCSPRYCVRRTMSCRIQIKRNIEAAKQNYIRFNNQFCHSISLQSPSCSINCPFLTESKGIISIWRRLVSWSISWDILEHQIQVSMTLTLNWCSIFVFKFRAIRIWKLG